jgi:glyoxylase-like metal-dependent hydrolase (beta-lactamase superfamily II)
MYPMGKTSGGAPAQVPTSESRAARSDDGEIHVLPVQGNVYMLVGGGGNTTVQAGKDGVLVVDTKQAAQADKLIAAIRGISDKPIRYVLNTSADADQTGGNEKVADAGRTITGGNVAGFNAGFPATMVAFEKVGARMREAGAPPASWPQDTYFVDSKDLFVNGEAVQLFHQPAAHSDGDSLVFFRRSDVVSTGEVFVPDRYPVIDVARGGSLNGVVAALNRILDLTVPADKQEGGTMVIPGHGRLCDEADVVEYRDAMTIIRDRIEDAVKKGRTLEQVKAARLTQDFDPLYGPSDAFVEAAYRSLAAAKK